MVLRIADCGIIQNPKSKIQNGRGVVMTASVWGGDREEPLVCLAGFLDGMRFDEQPKSARYVRLTESF